MIVADLYLDVLSSWCFFAQPAVARLRRDFAGTLTLRWRIAWLHDGQPLPLQTAQLELFYRRGRFVTGASRQPVAGWFTPGVTSSAAANLVAEAARDFGVADDRAWLAVAEFALGRGQPVDTLDQAAAPVATACGLDAGELARHAVSADMRARVEASTREFHALGATGRPTWVFKNGDALDDRAVLSGIVDPDTLAAVVANLQADAEAFARFAAVESVEAC